ncbi:MAG: helix-turn-helix domain-containing protein [Marinilabiliales bacterium]|nr:helix-turn-helix domain-containing protein [Marinilabiliales bacterium]
MWYYLGIALSALVMEYQDGTLARIGIRIVELRKLKGIKQIDLAISSGIDDSSLRRIEEGRANPTIKTLSKIAQALGVEVGDFFARKKDYSVTDPGLRIAGEDFDHSQEIEKSIEFLKNKGFLIFKSV